MGAEYGGVHYVYVDGEWYTEEGYKRMTELIQAKLTVCENMIDLIERLDSSIAENLIAWLYRTCDVDNKMCYFEAWQELEEIIRCTEDE